MEGALPAPPGSRPPWAIVQGLRQQGAALFRGECCSWEATSFLPLRVKAMPLPHLWPPAEATGFSQGSHQSLEGATGLFPRHWPDAKKGQHVLPLRCSVGDSAGGCGPLQPPPERRHRHVCAPRLPTEPPVSLWLQLQGTHQAPPNHLGLTRQGSACPAGCPGQSWGRLRGALGIRKQVPLQRPRGDPAVVQGAFRMSHTGQGCWQELVALPCGCSPLPPWLPGPWTQVSLTLSPAARLQPWPCSSPPQHWPSLQLRCHEKRWHSAHLCWPQGRCLPSALTTLLQWPAS